MPYPDVDNNGTGNNDGTGNNRETQLLTGIPINADDAPAPQFELTPLFIAKTVFYLGSLAGLLYLIISPTTKKYEPVLATTACGSLGDGNFFNVLLATCTKIACDSLTNSAATNSFINAWTSESGGSPYNTGPASTAILSQACAQNANACGFWPGFDYKNLTQFAALQLACTPPSGTDIGKLIVGCIGLVAMLGLACKKRESIYQTAQLIFASTPVVGTPVVTPLDTPYGAAGYTARPQ